MRKYEGFTLIELLVVVLIIGILAAVAFPQYQKSVDKSRFVQLQTAMDYLIKQNEIYFMANGSYAVDYDSFEFPSADCTFGNNRTRLSCGSFSCYNNNDGGNFGCGIALSSGEWITLEYFPYSKRTECLVSGPTTTNSRGYKLCKTFPHTSVYSGGCENTCYRFVLQK